MSWVPACRARTDEISSCWHDLRARYSDFFIQYTMQSVHTEETGSCVHCVNGLDQNADWYVNRQGIDRLSGAIVIYIGCHARRIVLCYTPGHPSVSDYLCVQLLLQFPSELDLFEICHKGIQSFWHPVISTPCQFDTFSCK